jgi:hypothetical protein
VSLLIGDPVCGPVLYLYAIVPGTALEPSVAYAHASDSWRISLRGSFVMGRKRYWPREFRLQRSSQLYPSDPAAFGPDGGWQILMFADRRGTRVRPTRRSAESDSILSEKNQGAMAAISGDLFSDDPADTVGDAGSSTTLGPVNASGYLDGSFDDMSGWHEDGHGTRVALALLGDRECGPAIFFVKSEPELESSGSEFGTEVIRAVIGGTGRVGEDLVEVGLIRLHTVVQALSAGKSRLNQVLIVGDRRALRDIPNVERVVVAGYWAPGVSFAGALASA